MGKDQLDDDAASILTVLPSYGSVQPTQPRRPNSPTPSYRTVDPNTTAQPQPVKSGRGLVRRLFNWQSRSNSQIPLDPVGSTESLPEPAPYRAATTPVEKQASENPACTTANNSPLTLAARDRNLARMRILLYDTTNNYRFTEDDLYHALRTAAAKDIGPILPLLVDYAGGADLVNPPLRTLLEDAIQADAVESLRSLLSIGAEASTQDRHGRTALHAAAASEKPSQCLKSLLLQDCSGFLSCRDTRGQTALHAAAGHGCIENMNLLVLHHADIHALDEEGRTPLHIAVEFANYPTATLLIELGVGMVSKDKSGQTPLHLSLEPRSQCEVALPIAREFLESRPGYDEEMFLAGSAYKIASALVFGVSNINADTAGMNGETALHTAVKLGIPEFVERLLLVGADIQARDRFTLTPMHYVGQCHRPAAAEEIFCKLLRYGADPHAKNSEGKTPLDMALENVIHADPHILSANRQRIGRLISAMLSTQPDCANTNLFDKYVEKMRQSREISPAPGK